MPPLAHRCEPNIDWDFVDFLFALELPPDFMPTTGVGLHDWLLLEVDYPAFAFYGRFVSTVVLPNFTFFAWLIFLAELGTGLSLLTGTLTRLGALIGLLLSINLGIGLLEVPGEWPWSYMMMAMWHGTFMITAPGRLWGVDDWLHSHWSQQRWLAWLV